jgi:mannose-6-phosphate isomerase-like protein (cupin superfamily)
LPLHVVRSGHETAAGVEIKLAADRTDGAVSVLQLVLQPGGGAPFHRHSREHEILVVLEESVRIEDDADTVELGEGDLVLITRGTRDAFTNSADRVARALVVTVPGGLERFFRDLEDGADPALAGERAGLEFG